MKRIAAGLLALGLFAAIAGGDASAAQKRQAPARVQGMTLGEVAHRAMETGGEAARLKAAGQNTVGITVWWNADELRSTVAPSEWTEPDDALANAIDSAHAAGLAVALLPMFHCDPCARSTWRGHVQPLDRAAFYDDYVAMIERYAAFAEAQEVELLYIGSELTSLQGDTEQWRRIAAAARSKFSGELVYDVNWDAVDQVKFWDAIDVPSVSAYFPLTEEAQPTVAELKEAWRSGRQRLTQDFDSFAVVERLARTTGKSVMFGEAGYRSREFAARQPFDGRATNGSVSQEAQANAYQALLEVFDPQPWWRGVIWWNWDIGPTGDTSFNPRGKAAEVLLRRWIVEGWRPGAAGEPQPSASPSAAAPRPRAPASSVTPSGRSPAPTLAVPSPGPATPPGVAGATGGDDGTRRTDTPDAEVREELAAPASARRDSGPTSAPLAALALAFLSLFGSGAGLARHASRSRRAA